MDDQLMIEIPLILELLNRLTPIITGLIGAILGSIATLKWGHIPLVKSNEINKIKEIQNRIRVFEPEICESVHKLEDLKIFELSKSNVVERKLLMRPFYNPAFKNVELFCEMPNKLDEKSKDIIRYLRLLIKAEESRKISYSSFLKGYNIKETAFEYTNNEQIIGITSQYKNPNFCENYSTLQKNVIEMKIITQKLQNEYCN